MSEAAGGAVRAAAAAPPASPASPASPRMPSRATLALIGAATGTGTLFYAALPPLLPDYVSAFGLTAGGTGALSAAFGAGALAGSLAAGLVAARSLRLAVLGGMLLALLGSGALALANGAWSVGGARFALGLAHAFVYTGTLAWLVRVAPPGRRTELIGAITSVAIVGGLLGPLLGVAASHVGGELAFGTATVAVGALAVTLARRVPAGRGARERRAGFVRAALRGPLALALWLIALHAGLQGVLAVLAPLRLDAAGWSAGGIAVLFIAASASGIVSFPLLGRLCDRHGQRAVLLVVLACSTLVSAGLALPGRHWSLAAIVVLCAVTYNGIAVPAVGLLSQRGQAAGYPQGLVTSLVPLTWAALNVVGAFAGAGLSEVGSLPPAAGAALLCVGTAIWLARGTGLRNCPGAPCAEQV